MVEDEMEKIVLEKLAGLASWFIAELTISEGRSEHDIERALQAIADDMGQEEPDDTLLMTWEWFMDDSVYFIDHPEKLETAIHAPFNPRLEVAEYALLVGLYLARAGIGRVIDSLPKQHLFAALLLANAVEAQAYWMAMRGLSGCRNPDHRIVRAEQALQTREREAIVSEKIRDSARRAADARHEKPGGSRDNRDKIRAIWASGKYSSRAICAEQECSALGMSFDTARKALRNTPDPT